MHLKEFVRKSTASHWIKQAQFGLFSQEEEIRWRATIELYNPTMVFLHFEFPFFCSKIPHLFLNWSPVSVYMIRIHSAVVIRVSRFSFSPT